MRHQHPDLRLQVGGTVNSRTGVYIVRPTDDQLLQLLEKGEYANVLCARQMGKSSLLVRTKSRLAEIGYAVAAIDVAGYLGSPDDADEWYQGLLDEIVRQLCLPVDVKRWWQLSATITANQRLIQFFREQIAAKCAKNVIIFLDEIDSTLRLTYTDDFFVAIRAMYNDRAGDPLNERITFCLVGVASPNELIKEPRTTPYNIGRTIELDDFNPDRDDLGPLFGAMASNPVVGETIVRSVLKWTDGHPYLTLRLCDSLLTSGSTSEEMLEDLVHRQFANIDHLHSDVHFQQVLRFLGERVDDRIAALALYRRICEGTRVRDHTTPAHVALKMTGLVKRDSSGYLIVRNRIYARVFSLGWVSKALDPEIEGFEKLLELLGPDRESAAAEYKRLYYRLVRLFAARGDFSAEELADETLNRVIERLERGAEISDVSSYCFGIAKKVWQEKIRRKNTRLNVDDILPVTKSLEDAQEDNAKYECLERCLETILPEQRDLIVRYHTGEGRDRIKGRQALAAELGISLNALRIRVLHLQVVLRKCVEECTSKRSFSS